jgi:hypothetical protein
MFRCTVEKHIAASPEEVFDLFADLRQAPGRIRAIKRLEVLTEGPIRAGTRFRETREMFGREATEEMEVTALERPSFYGVGCESCGCRYVSTFRFLPADGGTRVTIDFEGQPLTLMAKLMSPLVWLMLGSVRKCVEQDADDLKRILEAMPAAAQ